MSKSNLWDYNVLQVTIHPRLFWFLLTIYLTKYTRQVKSCNDLKSFVIFLQITIIYNMQLTYIFINFLHVYVAGLCQLNVEIICLILQIFVCFKCFSRTSIRIYRV